VRPARTRKEPSGRALSEGAKRAASAAAKAIDPDEKLTLNEWVADRIRTTKDGAAPSAGEVRAETMRLRAAANQALPARRRAKILPEPSRTWVYDRITAGKKLAAAGGLHVVRTERSA
jgi:hypothetical protein